MKFPTTKALSLHLESQLFLTRVENKKDDYDYDGFEAQIIEELRMGSEKA